MQSYDATLNVDSFSIDAMSNAVMAPNLGSATKHKVFVGRISIARTNLVEEYELCTIVDVREKRKRHIPIVVSGDSYNDINSSTAVVSAWIIPYAETEAAATLKLSICEEKIKLPQETT